MNLQKIKELENLKEELRQYGSKYENLSNERRHNYIVAAHNDFISFFKAKGFTINDRSKEIEAVYGSAKIKIDKYDEEEWYVGCYAVWNMSCKINKSKYRILLNKLGKYPTLSATYGGSKELSEDEKLDKDIELTKESIIKKKKDIEEFDTVKLGYGLINENEQNTDSKYPQFESMKKLLENIFE
ncbi:hypothetical protein FDE76_15330 [Clostridium botulinum]|uniref:Uncharacterized protein n=1 Tax=Clostridium botulinum (strain Eklund 17B / Type B) TaxID=935198 RepID=B2TMT8_CLOBB|nr:hypothetical protein CLL_A1892 [Clostridium botulinum B str. Eklund 17B (NRP)]MBY6977150.1 hypothetical protein [Clostridium botulinum]MBY6999307.1 hypothetical protein [Clostridium botulinum]MCR1272610.1 hypothetical protein [Clostridium botulinum]NFD70014.1 hypothetical protein [Clostridium botulinum]